VRDCRGEGRTDKTKTLKINVPPGVDEGTRIRLAGEGEAGARGAPAGDLYIFLHVAKHAIFERQGTTLFANAPISFTTAALGGEITLPGLDGEKHVIKIAPGTQPGREVRHRGAGMPVLQGRGRGDLVVRLEVEMPTRLTAKQRELLEEFRCTETGRRMPAETRASSPRSNWSALGQFGQPGDRTGHGDEKAAHREAGGGVEQHHRAEQLVASHDRISLALRCPQAWRSADVGRLPDR
jgi:DnaJ-class molecular chaperone